MAENARFRALEAVSETLVPKNCFQFFSTLKCADVLSQQSNQTSREGRDSRTRTTATPGYSVFLNKNSPDDRNTSRRARALKFLRPKSESGFLIDFQRLILDSSVDRGTPNFAAATVVSNHRPRLALRASSIMLVFLRLESPRKLNGGFDSVAG